MRASLRGFEDAVAFFREEVGPEVGDEGGEGVGAAGGGGDVLVDVFEELPGMFVEGRGRLVWWGGVGGAGELGAGVPVLA